MFNIFERGARALLDIHSPFETLPQSQPLAPAVLVVGLGRLGENLVVQTARTWHESYSQDQEKLRILVVDKESEAKVDSITKRFPRLSGCCDLISYQINPESPQFQNADFIFDESGNCAVSSIFVCLSNQTLGLQAALQLRHRINQNQPRIVVRMQEDSGLAKLLRTEPESGLASKNIVPFGLLQNTCTPDLVLGGIHEILAKAVHEDYLKQRLAEGLELGQKRSMVHWDDLPDDLRESNRRQVDHIRLKLLAVGYSIAPLSDWDASSYQFSSSEIETMAQLEHDYWVQERERKGWRFVAGPEDSKNKTHPDLLPWNQLSENAKEKDRQPAINLPKMLARAGFQVYKLNEK
jgi:hypothetical protein